MFGSVDHHSNTGRPRISQRTTVHVGDQIQHPRLVRWQQHALGMFLGQDVLLVSLAALSISTALWTRLWKNRKTRSSPSITRKGFNDLPLALHARLNWEIAPTTGIDKQ